MYHAAILTVSDRSFKGERPDAGGPLVAELLKQAGEEVVKTAIVPDAPPLRMELDREAWYAVADKRQVWAAIQPRDILLLK